MRLRHALLAATVIGLPLAARAQPVSGLYVAGGLGVNLLQSESVDATQDALLIPFNGRGSFKSDVGPTGVLSLGWGFGNGVRVELEANYMTNKFNGASGFDHFGGGGPFAGGISTSGGWEQKFGGMVNVFYDFTMVSPWVVPFVGVGIGYEGTNLQGVHVDSSNGLVSASVANTTQGSFAYQAMLGAAIPITAAPGLSFTAEYRFMGLAGTRTASYETTELSSFSRPGTVKFSDDYNHAILIGLRYAFGAPPPPAPAPMAAPAPAPARSYLVFFDWDKATLTPRAQQIISEAAANATKVQYTQIQVNGYTDTSGTPQYNQGLSIRRAEAVAAELVKDGVPKNAIAIQGFGETHLLVPTGPGVREPQNRRVEIIIR